jgi:phage shock protein PspC (stress-responsive transcriptional regulator)
MLWGVGVIIYLAALIIVPENPEEALEPRRQTANSSLFWGILFVAFGAVLLFWQMNLFRFFYFDIPWSTLWAVFLITIGGGLLYTQWKKQTEREKTETEDDVTGSGNANDGRFEIYRSRTDRKIAGICGGLAKYFHVDSSFIRLAWILMTFASKGLGLLLYIIFMFIFPEEPSRQTV